MYVWGGELALKFAFGWNPDLSLLGQRCTFPIDSAVIHCRGTLIIKLKFINQNVMLLIYSGEFNCGEDQSSSTYW